MSAPFGRTTVRRSMKKRWGTRESLQGKQETYPRTPLTSAYGVYTICLVLIEFDPSKDAANRAKHGVSLAVAAGFDWDTVRVLPARTERGELRLRVLGEIDGVLYSAIVTPRHQAQRIISLRRASRKERQIYGP
jgi:hypothetical protein